MQEINVEAELVVVEGRRRRNVTHEQDRYGGSQDRRALVISRRLRDVVNSRLELRPISEASLYCHDLLSQCQRHRHLEDLKIGEVAITSQEANLFSDRIV